MKNLFYNLYKQIVLEEQDYRGLHTAPNRESGSPLHDLSATYPEDIYSDKGALYYGHYGQNNIIDLQSISIIKSYHNKPNASIAIYRAVPNILSNKEKIIKYENEKRYILKYGKLPPKAEFTDINKSKYYEWLSDEIERLKNIEDKPVKLEINIGDWVTINKSYAKEHGETQFGNNYKILKKIVKAKDIFTNGDSIHEWGYDPLVS